MGGRKSRRNLKMLQDGFLMSNPERGDGNRVWRAWGGINLARESILNSGKQLWGVVFVFSTLQIDTESRSPPPPLLPEGKSFRTKKRKLVYQVGSAM